LAYVGAGWARPEPDFTWGIGAESLIVLPAPAAAEEYVLTIDVVPFVHPPKLRGQTLTVSINDTVVGSTDLSRPTLVGYRFPGHLASQAEQLTVKLGHPDATRPKDIAAGGDQRPLAFSVLEAKLYRVTGAHAAAAFPLPGGLMLGVSNQRMYDGQKPMELTEWAEKRTGLKVPDLAMRFESLGENCEFGLFQRRCDAEPLSLLRFSSTFMRNLIRGIDSGFEGLGSTEDIDPRLEGDARKEYMIHERKYGLVYHTFVYEGQRSIWLMREQESARLKFLLRKFMEDLREAEKIFVYQRNVPVAEEEILPLHMALNQYGPNTLLWVLPAEPTRPTGTVELVMPGLIKGYIDRFAPNHNAHDFSFDGWLSVCANACALDRVQKPALVSKKP
jgi:hypothetical protein